jgi:hypothetical protein
MVVYALRSARQCGLHTDGSYLKDESCRPSSTRVGGSVAANDRVAVTGSNEQPVGFSCLRTLVSVLHHRSRSPRLDVACPRTKCG